MNFSNYYRTFGLPDFSPVEAVISSYEYSCKSIRRYDEEDGKDSTEVLDRLKEAYNVLEDPEIKRSYDVALVDHLKLIREELNYYAILHIPEFTSQADEIKDGHFYEVLRLQPPENHTEALGYVTEAYAVLSDPAKKEKYDAELQLKRSLAEEK